MHQEQKNGLDTTIEAGMTAAHTIQAAVKIGKSISATTKGAAVGGPLGMVAGTILANSRHIGKIIAGIITLLMLPVLFILMLPGLVFGGFSSAASSADPNSPILNSETAVAENMNNITFSLNAIFTEALEDVIARINADFVVSGADHMEINNPYASEAVYNINLFISYYCAAKDTDFASISLTDMEHMLRQNKSHLYSFNRTREEHESSDFDPDTGETITTIEIWMIYTIVYNGESYFADTIFQLSDKQKELANNYAQNLSLFMGDGMLQYTEWTGNSLPSYGDISFSDGVTSVVYFNQMDERYANKAYGTDSIGGYGCGPTSMAIVVSSLTKNVVDPIQMAEWSYKNGYWCAGSGSYHSLIPAAAKAWGLPVSGCTVSEPQRILDALADGKLVVALMAKGHFTNGGHFIVLRGVKDGKIMVADPGSYQRSEKLWDFSIILNEASRRAGAGGPFWIIG